MNSIDNPIPTLEKRIILFVSLFIALFYLSEFAVEFKQSLEPKYPTTINFAVDDPTPRVPAGLHLITVPIFLSLIRPRTFVVAAIFTVLYAALLLLSFYIRVDGQSFFGGPIPGSPGFFEELYLKTYIWDYVGLAFLIVLLPWLVSILYRVRSRRSNRRDELSSE